MRLRDASAGNCRTQTRRRTRRRSRSGSPRSSWPSLACQYCYDGTGPTRAASAGVALAAIGCFVATTAKTRGAPVSPRGVPSPQRRRPARPTSSSPSRRRGATPDRRRRVGLQLRGRRNGAVRGRVVGRRRLVVRRVLVVLLRASGSVARPRVVDHLLDVRQLRPHDVVREAGSPTLVSAASALQPPLAAVCALIAIALTGGAAACDTIRWCAHGRCVSCCADWRAGRRSALTILALLVCRRPLSSFAACWPWRGPRRARRRRSPPASTSGGFVTRQRRVPRGCSLHSFSAPDCGGASAGAGGSRGGDFLLIDLAKAAVMCSISLSKSASAHRLGKSTKPRSSPSATQFTLILLSCRALAKQPKHRSVPCPRASLSFRRKARRCRHVERLLRKPAHSGRQSPTRKPRPRAPPGTIGDQEPCTTRQGRPPRNL